MHANITGERADTMPAMGVMLYKTGPRYVKLYKSRRVMLKKFWSSRGRVKTGGGMAAQPAENIFEKFHQNSQLLYKVQFLSPSCQISSSIDPV